MVRRRATDELTHDEKRNERERGDGPREEAPEMRAYVRAIVAITKQCDAERRERKRHRGTTRHEPRDVREAFARTRPTRAERRAVRRNAAQE